MHCYILKPEKLKCQLKLKFAIFDPYPVFLGHPTILGKSYR